MKNLPLRLPDSRLSTCFQVRRNGSWRVKAIRQRLPPTCFTGHLYAIKTQGQHRQEFYAWLDSLKKGKVSYEIEKEYVSESRRRKQRKYWRETVINDSAIYWAWNLTILKKKLEYNIGYWRYVQRHVGWQEDVNRMLTAVGLINIAETEYPEIKGKHINQRTATKYTREPISEAPEMEEFDLSRLYRDKAFHILWKWLDHNMKDWWD